MERTQDRSLILNQVQIQKRREELGVRQLFFIVDVQLLEEMRCFFRADILRLAQIDEALLGYST